ncbi:class I SAM-dependent methyltransferase [Methanobacterium spitsbergense]|uniref:Methyltransferase domain-containing protein n=1 Tax=Methanobacterium spitsbergense TaxID=2874285 RepID=A0A8T5V454_9EURY|nr:methyltransferase domain-containing protein [Methanobacterium spitsbergense]MBZ2166661.1 methyltransferase domain-containing protein [Methanobacterium spitsbergense]
MDNKDISPINNTNKAHFRNLDSPIFIGRTWTEYIKMFNIDPENIAGEKILDCASGASSFTAMMSKKGFDIKAVDKIYNETPEALSAKCKEHLELLVEGLKSVDHFVWGFFSDIEDLKKQRNIACRKFIDDYRKYKGERYIGADLKSLPFKDNSFSIVLCSHLLFIYDHRLDYNFHLNAIKEMLRVSSNELKIYPLVKNRGKKSEFVKKIINDLTDVDVEIVKVDYEFRKGGNEMLRIVK